MNMNEPTPRKPLRLWPGVVARGAAVARQVVIADRHAHDGRLRHDRRPSSAHAGCSCGGCSSAGRPGTERVGAIVLMIVAVLATKSSSTSRSAGTMGNDLIFAIPALGLALVGMGGGEPSSRDRRASRAADRRASSSRAGRGRWSGPVASPATRRVGLHWRWTPTPEERLLAQADERSRRYRPLRRRQPRQRPKPRGRGVAETSPPSRDSEPPTGEPAARRPGSRASEPSGPAFADPGATASSAACGSRPTGRSRRRSSCGAGRSDRAGRPSPSTATSSTPRSSAATTRSSPAYNLTTGEPVWRHRDAARFWESNGGAGPRATPTLSDGRVYTLGATGILNALDAGDGAVVWSRNAASDTGTQVPDWGFSSSPLVVGDVVIVAAVRHARRLRPSPPASRAGRARPAAAATARRSSLTIDGVAQVLLMSGAGATSVAPADGKVLWEHPWPGVPIVQPALIAGRRHPDQSCQRRAERHAPPRGRARTRRMDRRGALDLDRAEAVLQRLRRPRGPCLRLRRPHPRVHRPRGRQAQVEGRPLRLRPARPAARPGSAAGAVGGRRAGAGQGDARPVHGARASSRRSRARPGTTRCWSATSCWSATARRWPRSGCPSRAADRDCPVVAL